MEDIVYDTMIPSSEGTPARSAAFKVDILPTSLCWVMGEKPRAYEAERSW